MKVYWGHGSEDLQITYVEWNDQLYTSNPGKRAPGTHWTETSMVWDVDPGANQIKLALKTLCWCKQQNSIAAICKHMLIMSSCTLATEFILMYTEYQQFPLQAQADIILACLREPDHMVFCSVNVGTWNGCWGMCYDSLTGGGQACMRNVFC